MNIYRFFPSPATSLFDEHSLPKPASVDVYFDKVHAFIYERPREETVKALKPFAKKVFVTRRNERIIHISQPQPGICISQPHHIFDTEQALDFSFIYKSDLLKAFAYIKRFVIFKRVDHEYAADGTLYLHYTDSDMRVVIYIDLPPRKSLHRYCLHIEIRRRSKRANMLRGLHKIEDLAKYNHLKNWLQEAKVADLSPENLHSLCNRIPDADLYKLKSMSANKIVLNYGTRARRILLHTK